MSFEYDGYLSVFTWRYGTDSMRRIWSQEHKRRLWRQLWAALAESQAEAGLVTDEQAADLRAHVDDIDIARAQAIEAEIKHDLMAEIRAFAEQCPDGGGIIHLGATSADIQDNADALRIRESLCLTESALEGLLGHLADQIERWANEACIGMTHLQPAEPTTIGYRLAVYGQDLLMALDDVRRARESVRGKGLKGAVGTAASYADLLTDTGTTPAELEADFMARAGLETFPVTGQTVPRMQEFRVLNALAAVGGVLYRFAFDLRLLQSPFIMECSEPFATGQVGSSAMPFKRNPVNAENVDSLGRFVAALPRIAWDNAAHTLLERTLDDSANRRIVLPAAFLAVDEMVKRGTRIVKGLNINAERVQKNLNAYGAFSGIERVLMALVKAGADRQIMHERLREHAMAAWETVAAGGPNPLVDRLTLDEVVRGYLQPDHIRALMDASGYVGDAPERARKMAAALRASIRKKIQEE